VVPTTGVRVTYLGRSFAVDGGDRRERIIVKPRIFKA
jgi:hypothetical protein